MSGQAPAATEPAAPGVEMPHAPEHQPLDMNAFLFVLFLKRLCCCPQIPMRLLNCIGCVAARNAMSMRIGARVRV